MTTTAWSRMPQVVLRSTHSGGGTQWMVIESHFSESELSRNGKVTVKPTDLIVGSPTLASPRRLLRTLMPL
jgi:hypothetical protein